MRCIYMVLDYIRYDSLHDNTWFGQRVKLQLIYYGVSQMSWNPVYVAGQVSQNVGVDNACMLALLCAACSTLWFLSAATKACQK